MSEKSRLQRRLAELQQEHEKGRQMLAELQQQEAELQQKLLRISGAIQVLEELLNPPDAEPADGESLADESAAE